MPFSDKQQEFFQNASHRWNIKVGATRSGKTYMDYYVIPKRIRARIGKEGLVAILGVSKGTIHRNIIEPLQHIWGTDLVGDINSQNICRCLARMFIVWVLRRSARYPRFEDRP
ncbi:hypothetical protein [Clostridium sp. OF09-36]|uniref:hypothetical protein n=1 Tax=Clostridium sp. OF09-36 TaxID=2292310 RepID=UPI00325ADF32